MRRVIREAGAGWSTTSCTSQPTGLRYATFRLDDGRIFAHVVVDETLHQRTRCWR
jgi:hypothetical protein